ncbi:MAG TPA: DUF2752 domain-containing protein [Pyrinomonadaceae bacterium]|nr:DUF2752 domain-containing protein [Pyrinomonadaceae bacterium]
MRQTSERLSRERAFVWPSAAEWWGALRWVLLTFTLLVALSLAGSFFPYERVVAEGHPWLPRFHCAGCPLCGMTRAFCALTAGRFGEALRWNRGAPALYSLFWLWLGIALTYVFKAARRRMEGLTTETQRHSL